MSTIENAANADLAGEKQTLKGDGGGACNRMRTRRSPGRESDRSILHR